MRADKEQRRVCTDDKPTKWTCRSRFRLAQTAELPKQPVAGARPSSRARHGEGKLCIIYARSCRGGSVALQLSTCLLSEGRRDAKIMDRM